MTRQATSDETDTTETPASRDRRAALLGTGFLLVAIVLVAANLRPAVSSLGSILGDVRASLGASTAWASVLTAFPGLCFGLAGFLSPVLARKLGMARAVGGSVALVVVGLLLRILDGPVVVLLGTFVACTGIAVCNVLIPVVVKESFPHRLGLITGAYTGSLQLAAALGSALTPRMENAFGDWRPALGAWAAIGVVGLASWTAAARHGRATQADGAPPSQPHATRSLRSLARNRLAWLVTAFFGLQSLFAYVMMGWMPQVLVDAGVDRSTAGALMALTSVLGVPGSLIVTPIAVRMRNQAAVAAGMTVIGIAGVLGLLLAPAAAPLLWSILIGVGMGVFSVAVALISLRTKASSDTRSLSTMSQGLGYLLAAAGPLVFGMLHGITGSWDASLIVLLAALTLQVAVGLVVGRPRFV